VESGWLETIAHHVVFDERLGYGLRLIPAHSSEAHDWDDALGFHPLEGPPVGPAVLVRPYGRHTFITTNQIKFGGNARVVVFFKFHCPKVDQQSTSIANLIIDGFRRCARIKR
jgi:hypothetical protein